MKTEAIPCERVPSLTAHDLCDRYAERVYRFASMVSKGDAEAEDIAQDALERAIRALPSFDPSRGTPEAWLWKIVVNVANDAGRSARRRHLLLEKLLALRAQEPVHLDIPESISDPDILAAIRELRPREREAIALRFAGDLDYATAGNLLGISAAAAGVATRRALAHLRRRLTKPQGGKEI